MRQIYAIARLTFWEGIRMRIVMIFVGLLIFLVLYMPFTLRGDGTLAGQLQNFLGYGLGAVGLLLSLSTIFLSCSTLSTEMREKSLHLVVTKPVTRFQILLGKWLGVNLLNLLLLGLCGGAIFGFAHYIAGRQEQFARDRLKVRDVVWTARVPATPTPPDFVQIATEEIDAQVAQGALADASRPGEIARFAERLRNEWRVVPRGDARYFEFDIGVEPKHPDQVIQVRFKAIGSPVPPDEMLKIGWVFLNPDGSEITRTETTDQSGNMHEFLVSARGVIKDRKVRVVIANLHQPPSNTNLLFTGEDSLQVLYRIGGFELNYAKAILLMFMRLAFLSAVGLFFSVFVSFPVACLCAATFLLMSMGLPWWLESIGANMEMDMPNIDPYGRAGKYVRVLLVPLIKFLFPNFSYYDGGRQLIDGEFIHLRVLGWCALHMLGLGGALLLLPGWLIFERREVAEVQV